MFILYRHHFPINIKIYFKFRPICCLVYRLTNIKYPNVTCTIYFKVEFSSYLIVVLKRGAKTTRQCVDNLQISDTLYAVDFKISCCNKKSYDNTYEKKMLCFLFIWCLLMWMYINETMEYIQVSKFNTLFF